MRSVKTALGVLAIAAAALTATSAFAHGGRARVHFGFHFGVPLYYPSYYYYPAPVVYSPPVVIQSAPQVYTERYDAAPAPAPQGYWYYCSAARGYYPYVKDCPSGWERVPAAPAQ